MPKLSFYGVPDMMVIHPNAPVDPNPRIGVVGQAAKYIGYRYQATKPNYVLTGEVDSFEDSDSQKIRALKIEVKRDGCLVPADKYTADACGIDFVAQKNASKPAARSQLPTTSDAPKGDK